MDAHSVGVQRPGCGQSSPMAGRARASFPRLRPDGARRVRSLVMRRGLAMAMASDGGAQCCAVLGQPRRSPDGDATCTVLARWLLPQISADMEMHGS